MCVRGGGGGAVKLEFETKSAFIFNTILHTFSFFAPIVICATKIVNLNNVENLQKMGNRPKKICL